MDILTVVDRFSQVLSIIYECQFSDGNFGFRPKRSVHNALLSVCRHVSVGCRYAVGIDLEGFFDAVHHSRLLEIFSRTIKDGCVISLIHKYLRSGVMVDSKYKSSEEGIPQGGLCAMVYKAV